MIRGIGSGLVDVDQVAEAAMSGTLNLGDIFTGKEVAYCESKARKAEHYAARLAAKRAVLRALGQEDRDNPACREIEIESNEAGEPRVGAHGRIQALFKSRHISQACISLSHTRRCALALVILEG